MKMSKFSSSPVKTISVSGTADEEAGNDDDVFRRSPILALTNMPNIKLIRVAFLCNIAELLFTVSMILKYLEESKYLSFVND
jgi:hypothetical protein